ncbi:DUF1289 domain-containing protein [Salinimonas iocasae]|uniref:DUF1289 domain-containing protein n=1 Tax=Salinimonas iocasae TaxID=2572577 RepID=A0A5B7YC41_9ALTE|nr:DUF1289 domain-containing protein [Salinimonas iocasae]QCZ92796.1 DUF1289 domain-containing protein [Salinimonas iocasae]
MTDSTSSQPAQLEFFEVPSPCIGVCQSGPRGYCKGCFRSRDERLYWLQVDAPTRRKIVAACYRRKQAALRKKRQAEKENLTPVQSQFDLFDNNS